MALRTAYDPSRVPGISAIGMRDRADYGRLHRHHDIRASRARTESKAGPVFAVPETRSIDASRLIAA